MDAIAFRPQLASFRVVAFSGKHNPIATEKPMEMAFEMQPQIDLELRLPTEEKNPLEAVVHIKVTGKAALKDAPDQPVSHFEAEYEARFVYPQDAKESDIAPRFEREPYQYILVSQTFPLASSHFRRELLSMGIDVRNLPLGL